MKLLIKAEGFSISLLLNLVCLQASNLVQGLAPTFDLVIKDFSATWSDEDVRPCEGIKLKTYGSITQPNFTGRIKKIIVR